MAGGGLALMVVPPLTDATSWRAPYWSAALLACSQRIPTLAARAFRASATPASGCSATASCSRSACSRPRRSGSRSIAGNWVVPLLERQGASSTAAGLAGGLILFVGIVTRPAEACSPGA